MTSVELEQAVAATSWDGDDGMTPEDLDAIEREVGRPIPADVRTFYLWSEGGDAESVHFFDRDELAGANRSLSQNLPRSGFFIASDGGDGWFFFDAEGALGAGKGAVLWMERGWPVPDDLVPVAADIPAFLRIALHATEANPSWERRGSIRDRRIQLMRVALAAHPAALQGTPGVSEDDIGRAEDRLDCRVPRELIALLEVSDGARIGSLQFSPVLQLGPVVDIGEDAFALRCAGAPGVSYAVTFRGKKEPNGGRLFRMTDGVAPQQGTLLGPLPTVVIDLLQGREGVLQP
jgi:cell wall assembly regulator SMI1